MTAVAVTSVRSSPGATSLAVALGAAWATERGGLSLLVEADPAGGVLGLRFDLPGEPSLATLSADMRRHGNRSLILANSVELLGARCVPAPSDPFVTRSALTRSADTLANQLQALALPTIIDLGRVDRRSPSLPLAAGADLVLVVCRPRPDEVQAAMFTIRLLRSSGCRVGLVAVGDRPHHPQEVADLAGVPLIAVLPDDPTMAVAFSGGRYVTRKLRRSTLWRSVLALSATLLDRYPVAAAPDGPVPAAAVTPDPAINAAAALLARGWPPPTEDQLTAPTEVTTPGHQGAAPVVGMGSAMSTWPSPPVRPNAKPEAYRT